PGGAVLSRGRRPRPAPTTPARTTHHRHTRVLADSRSVSTHPPPASTHHAPGGAQRTRPGPRRDSRGFHLGFNDGGQRAAIRLYSDDHMNANAQAVAISTSSVPTNAPYVSCRGRSDATSAPRNCALNKNWNASRQTTAST